MSLDQFIASVKNKGISRDNRFEVEGGAVPKEAKELIQTVSLPGIQFHTAIYRNVGHGRRYINNAFYNEITLAFHDHEDMPIQKFYNEWAAQIYNALGQFQYKDDYTNGRNLIVKKFNRQKENESVIEYEFDKVFPINVSEVPLNQAGVNTPSLLTVTLSYDQWRII